MRSRTLLILLATALVPGCYDSRWGEAKRAQQHNAARATPASLQATGDTVEDAGAAAGPVARTYRVRVYASPAYESQTVDWRRRVTELLSDADQILTPSTGVRLEVETFNDWSTGEEDLQTAVASLKARDDGHDVDWVMGFVGGLSRATRSFHELGMANVPGKHLVVRASRDLDEQAAIDRGLDELKEEDRAKLVRVRMRHRATAVLLHEIGHTLGAIHARDPRDLMHPQYDTHMEAFGPGALALMKADVRHRDDGDTREQGRALLEALEQSPPDVWIDGEREPYEVRLQAMTAPPTAAPPTATPEMALAPAEKPLPPDVVALSPDARARFTEATNALEKGNAEGAHATALPLFASLPNVYSVQDLRCKIAMARSLDWAASRAECDRLMKLSTAKPGK